MTNPQPPAADAGPPRALTPADEPDGWRKQGEQPVEIPIGYASVVVWLRRTAHGEGMIAVRHDEDGTWATVVAYDVLGVGGDRDHRAGLATYAEARDAAYALAPTLVTTTGEGGGMNEPTRCPCGQPADGWPGEGDDELCLDCWERQCSAAWWRVHQAVARALHPETFPEGREEAGQ